MNATFNFFFLFGDFHSCLSRALGLQDLLRPVLFKTLLFQEVSVSLPQMVNSRTLSLDQSLYLVLMLAILK